MIEIFKIVPIDDQCTIQERIYEHSVEIRVQNFVDPENSLLYLFNSQSPPGHLGWCNG